MVLFCWLAVGWGRVIELVTRGKKEVGGREGRRESGRRSIEAKSDLPS